MSQKHISDDRRDFVVHIFDFKTDNTVRLEVETVGLASAKQEIQHGGLIVCGKLKQQSQVTS